MDVDDEIARLEAEKEAGLEYVAEEKPYWLSLRHPRDEPMQWALFNYFPAAHYDKRIAALEAMQEDYDELRPDGGRYTDTLYAWYDPNTDTYLTHVEAGDEFASPFFPDETAARRYLDHRAHEVDDTARFEGLSLHKLRAKKIGEAVEVLTDQAGIDEFVPDGGHQLPTPRPDRVWFWYNPSADHILQEEVEPYDIRGVFATEDDAYRFLEWYADRYDVPDTSHLELYSAAIELQGFGRKHAVEHAEEGGGDGGPPAQADFARFRDDASDPGDDR